MSYESLCVQMRRQLGMYYSQMAAAGVEPYALDCQLVGLLEMLKTEVTSRAVVALMSSGPESESQPEPSSPSVESQQDHTAQPSPKASKTQTETTESKSQLAKGSDPEVETVDADGLHSYGDF